MHFLTKERPIKFKRNFSLFSISRTLCHSKWDNIAWSEGMYIKWRRLWFVAVNIKNDSFCMSCLSYEMNTFQSLGLWPKFNSCNSSFLLKWLFKLLFKVIELIYILKTFLLYSKYNIFWIVIISSHSLNSWRSR